jgi:hypothetical protein
MDTEKKKKDFVSLEEMPGLRSMVDELLQVEEGLNPAEITFLEGLESWGGWFTERQAAWLEKIYQRIKG